MNELPEIETTRRDLERDITGRKVKTVEVSVAKIVGRSGNRTRFADALDGVKIETIDRLGLWLLARLDNGATLAINLGREAQLRRHANRDKTEPKTVAVITFTQGGQLRVVDPLTETEMLVVPDEELIDAIPELVGLGHDPVTEPMSWTDFAHVLMSHELKLKSLLLDQSIIVGLGDVYSDEILFHAGVRYDRVSNTLSMQEIRRFYRALVETMHDAIKYRGTTLEDEGYTDVFGESGSYQEHLAVYGKHGELSPRSRRPIARTKFAKRWTYYCEQSQV